MYSLFSAINMCVVLNWNLLGNNFTFVVDDVIEFKHHKGAFQNFFKGDYLRNGEYVTMIAGADKDDLNIGRFAAIEQYGLYIDIVNRFAKFQEITVIEAGRFSSKINIPAPFCITLKNCTLIGTENFCHSVFPLP